MGIALFDEFVQDKVFPMFGDLTEPNIGLSDSDLDLVMKHTNIIFHCAGNVDGNVHIDASVQVKQRTKKEKVLKYQQKNSRLIHLVHFTF